MNLDKPHFYPDSSLADKLNQMGVCFRADNLENNTTTLSAFPFADLIRDMYNRIQVLEKRLDDSKADRKRIK